MTYSEKKFRDFSKAKQEKIFLQFIRRIEVELNFNVLEEFRNCLKFTGNTFYKEISKKLESVKDISSFLEIVVPLERALNKDLRDHDFVIFTDDKFGYNIQTIPLTLVLDNLRSAFNVGSIFRTAECFSIKELILCGYTATPENDKVKKTSMGTSNKVKWKIYEQTRDAIRELKLKGNRIYALETTSNAININQTQFKKPCALILGNEALGISKEILNLVDEIIFIRLSGTKNSLNVGSAAAIACYAVSTQW
jgi:tRNA G18 (ribose-2'-O)-methylase SpoU